jgi:hypothetical protein
MAKCPFATPRSVFLPAVFEELAWRGFGVEVMTERGHSHRPRPVRPGMAPGDTIAVWPRTGRDPELR